MYVKKNLLLWVAVLALALPLVLTGTASAKYMSDGAVPAPAGGFVAPTDGICVLSIDMAGNLVTDATITNKRDCDARLVDVTAVTTGDTLANVCGNATKNTAAVKYAAPGSSTCVTIDGSGFITGSISMANLDRGAVMCQAKGGQLANATVGGLISTATKTVASATAAKCLAYGWQYRGQDATGTPVALSSGAGFCYTSMRTSITPTTSCPSVVGSSFGTKTDTSSAAFGYSVSGTYCLYAYGVNGPINAALTKANGTTYAAGATVDLSAFNTIGTCLANGGSWANWMPNNGTATANGLTYATFDLVNQAVNADEGCLHCHSTKVQQNGPSERWKDSYLKTGHKNMLRKVVAGNLLTGADGLPYTTDGTNAITMAAGTVNVAGVDHTIRYVWGDWMAVLPTIAYDGGATYGCGACHTAGFKDNANPGVQSIGTPGYTPAEPAKSGAAYVAAVTAGHKWDVEGIGCGRCHNATVPSVTSAQIAASGFKTTAPTNGGMGALAAGTGRNNLCFGCHQSIAKNWPAQGGAAAGTTQYNPTLIPTGVSHGAAVGRDFNGHVLGNSFLNSVHAKYAGVNNNAANGGIVLNSLGKFDLFDPNGTSEYNSLFKGYTCWTSATGNSPAKTKANGTEIKTKSDCDALYACSKVGYATQSACTTAGGTWATSWRADASGDLGSTQGTCTTCHDVHNSLFVPEQEEAAMRKTCDDCHVNNATTGATDAASPQVVVANINHPKTAGTPFDASKYESACVVCHMATQAEANGDQNSMPVHVWRINTNASYNTFPTADQWDGLNGATKDRNAQVAADGSYANAVWVDLDLACGQCHGGSLGAGKTHNGAPYRNKADLAALARGIHDAPIPVTDPTPGPIVTATSAFSVDGFTATYVDASTSGSGNLSIRVTWGDGKTSIVAKGSTTTHVYARARAYNAKATVYDMGVNGTFRKVLTDATVSKTLTVLPLSISGTVTDNLGAPLQGVVMTLEQVTTKTIVRKKAVTRVDGTYTFNNVVPNAATGPATSGTPYTLVATKAKGGFTFPAIATFSVTNASVAGKDVSAN